jgi:hypothetical protein
MSVSEQTRHEPIWIVSDTWSNTTNGGNMDREQVKQLLTEWADETSLPDEILAKVISEFGSLVGLSVSDEQDIMEVQ